MLVRTRLKICGITSVDDADTVAAMGADALGLIFYPPSPRFVNYEAAAVIARRVPVFTSVVGVFVNPTVDEVSQVIQTVNVSVLQFHGEESDKFCSSFGLPYIKALQIGYDTPMIDFHKTYPGACAVLLDTYDEALYGGTGRVFPWKRGREIKGLPVILAGGLTERNVAQAISASGACAVDVSSGVEISPGKKDAEKIKYFARAVVQYDAGAMGLA